jgi:autotransporter-associated beta strand protein
MKLIHKLALAAVLTAAATTTSLADSAKWSSGGLSNNWSDTNNWVYIPQFPPPPWNRHTSLPGSLDVVNFEDIFYTLGYPPGWTNAPGVVNNTVDANTAVGAANYTAVSVAAAPHFYTTLINSQVTLTLGGLGALYPALDVGDVPGNNPPYYAGPGTNLSTITGPGTLSVNDASGLILVGMTNRATLDMSGLNTFNATVGNLWVGVTADLNHSTAPNGWTFLAQTNTITTSANTAAPGILLGAVATNGTGVAVMNLGSTNTFSTDALVVGGRGAGSGGGSVTILQFNPNYLNANPLPGFTLRGSAGNTAISVFSIGDLSADTTSFNASPGGGNSAGTADFSGGTVDIWADSLYIGRSTPATVTSTSTGSGALIVENGTVTATNVFMNYKMTSTNNTVGSGSSLVLRGNTTMNVVNNLYLTYRTNGNASIGQSSLYVSNNAVLNVGGDILFTNVGGSLTTLPIIGLGNSGTINLTNGGNVIVGNLTGIGTIAGANTISVSNALSANTDTSVGTLTLSSNLLLGKAVTLTFNLGTNNTIGGGTNDYIKVGNNVTFNNNPIKLTFGGPLVTGQYTLMSYGGTQFGSVAWTNPTRLPIGLVQGGGTVGINVTNSSPTKLIWQAANIGTATTNWDGTNFLWNGNADKFYALDNVVFDDSGLATNVNIPLLTTLIPGNITFSNSTKKYTISQTSAGLISGFTGIDKWGTGMVVMGAGNAQTNSFTGPVNINQGTVQINSSTTSPGVFGVVDATNAINIASGAMLNLNNGTIGTVTSGTYGRYVNLAGSGIGGIGALVNSNSGSGIIYVRNVTLTGDATIGATLANGTLTMNGIAAPYGFMLDLAGHSLSTVGAVKLNQLTVTNSGSINGSINVGGPYLGINSGVIDGPGTLNLGANYLNFYNAFTAGYVAKAISVANGGAIFAGSASAATIPIQSLITITNNGTFYITNSGQPIQLSGQISQSPGVVAGLTKYGNSNLVMSASNLYTGTTEVGAGSLVLNPGGSLASSLIQVDSTNFTVLPPTFDVTALSGGYTLPFGQTLNVNGFTAGNLTAGLLSTISGFGTNRWNVTVTSGTLAPGSSLLQGTLTINSNLTFNGGKAVLKLDATTNAGAGNNDLIVVGGNLSFTGTNTINIVPVAALSSQPYTLFTYGGTLSGATNISLTSGSPRYSFTLDTSVTNVVRAIATGTGGNLIWQGGAVGNTNAWDVNFSSNWLNGASLDRFYQGDLVTFDDTATTNLVTISTQVKPASITVNSTNTYVLNGSGSLLAGTLVANSGTFTIANTNNNLFNGNGIQLNGGSVTFNQPSNATITAQLSGSAGALNKNGTNTLTWTSPDSTAMSATVNINAGTLRAASTNVLGSGTITITSGATLDINGQYMSAGTFHASGAGADGLGAINNRGLSQTHGLTNVVLDANTTLGAASNRWDISPVDSVSTGTLQGNNFNVVKTGSADLWIRPLTDTGLGDIDVSAGRLVFAGLSTTTGNSTSNIVVRTNAVLGFSSGIQDAGKNTLIQAGGQLYGGILTNEFDGAITLSNTLVKVEPAAQLTLGGNLSGPGTLTVQGVSSNSQGYFVLSGSNSYTGGTLVNDGTLVIASSNSLPANTNVTLSGRVPYNQQLALPALSLGAFVSPASVRLVMQTTNSVGPVQAALIGNGTTWVGPIRITGTNNAVANFIAGTNGLTINGVIDATNFTANSFSPSSSTIVDTGFIINGGTANTTNLTGSALTFNSVLYLPGSLKCLNWQNQNGLMTKLVLNAPGNFWAAAAFYSGMIQIGTDNAVPPMSPLWTDGSRIGSGGDGRFVFDLNGHNQALGSFTNKVNQEVGAWFGNSSTSADSTLSYVGTGTNIWSAFIVDAFDTNAPIQRKTGLTVTSGYLWLQTSSYTDGDTRLPLGPPGPMANTYSGPTLVSGGLLRADADILNSPVTVNGGGTLGGTGTLSGPVVINTGGRLSPGGSIGTLTINNNLSLAGNLYIEVNKALSPAQTNDYVVVTGTANNSGTGTVTMTNLNLSQPFVAGDQFTIFSQPLAGGGAMTISPAKPGPGLIWINNLAVDGSIGVQSVSLNPTPITVSVSGSTMTLSWPADHLGWRLQVQTNALSVGLTNNANAWATVPGSTNALSYTAQIVTMNPTVFYRLVYP